MLHTSAFQLAEKYLPIQKPEFVNIAIPTLDTSATMARLGDGEEEAKRIADEDYQPITAKEEADFNQMLREFNLNISQAKLFHEKLTRRLTELDNTNIDTIMKSEDKVASLINDLDECESHMRFLSARLEGYDVLLKVCSIFLLYEPFALAPFAAS